MDASSETRSKTVTEKRLAQQLPKLHSPGQLPPVHQATNKGQSVECQHTKGPATTTNAAAANKKLREEGLPMGDDGEFVTAWELIQSSGVLNKSKKDVQARMHSCLTIETSTAQKYQTELERAGDKIDVVQLATQTGLGVKWLNNLLALFTLEQKGYQNKPLQFDKFKKLMRKINFTTSMVVERLFHIFDVDNEKALNFRNLVVGLAFFLPQSEEKMFTDPKLVPYMCQFFDLDGLGRLSQLELYKVLQPSIPKKYFQSCMDVLWDVIANGSPGDVEFTAFEKQLQACYALKKILHKIMILQGTELNSIEHQQQMRPILDLTEQWRQAKAAGRINSLDNIVRQFLATSDQGERAGLAFTADAIVTVKRGNESLVASYYVKVMRMIMDNGANYVASEYKSICDKLKKMAQDKANKEKMAAFLRTSSNMSASDHEELMELDAELDDEEKHLSNEQIQAKLEWKKSVMDVFMGSA